MRTLIFIFLIVSVLLVGFVISHDHHDDSDIVYEMHDEDFVYKNDVYAGLMIDENDFVEVPPSLTDECHFKTKINCGLVHPSNSLASCVNQCQCKRDRHTCECEKTNDPECTVNSSQQHYDTCISNCGQKFGEGKVPGDINNDRAILGTTTGENYLFFTPITSLVWRYYLHYVPLTFLVAPQGFRPYDDVSANKQSKETALLRYVIQKTQEIEHSSVHSDATVSQVARLYAGMLNFSTGLDTYLLTCDIDMWPVSYSHFHNIDPKKSVFLDYANAYAHNKQEVMYPICYIGAKARTWQDIMGYSQGDVRSAVLKQLDEAAEQYKEEWNKPGYGAKWYYDQKLFGQKIAAWSGHPKDCQKVNRPPDYQFLADRIDRGRWNFNGKEDLRGKVDAHVLRPGYLEENWGKLKVLLKELLSKEQMDWVENYRMEYLRLTK